MKRKYIQLSLLFIVICIGVTYLKFHVTKLYQTIDVEKVNSIMTWANTKRVANVDENLGFNSIKFNRHNKDYTGETSKSGILKNRSDISILKSGLDFEVQKYNFWVNEFYSGKKQSNIYNLLGKEIKGR